MIAWRTRRFVLAVAMVTACGVAWGIGTGMSQTQTTAGHLRSDGLVPAVLIVDVSGDGVNLTGAQDGVLFDFGSRTLARTGWTRRGADDSLLVVELQRDGVVSSGLELLGGTGPPNGFDYLRLFDGVKTGAELQRVDKEKSPDGVIDSRDAIFDRVLLWTDANHDGRSQEGELQSFAYAGFEALDLPVTATDRRDEQGNYVRQRSVAMLKTKDGHASRMVVAVELSKGQ